MSRRRGLGHQYQLLNREGSRGQAEGWPNFKGKEDASVASGLDGPRG